MADNSSVAPPVLNISGCSPLRKKTPKQNKTEVQYVPKFDHKEFPSILSGILFEADHPTDLKSIEYDKKCLAVMCVRNNTAKVRLYHMYCTTENRVWIDNHNVKLLYNDMPYNQQRRQHLIVDTFFPEILLRRAVQHFSMYKWNKDENVLETPMSATDENIIFRTLKELCVDKEEDQRLLNYIQFLKISKS